MPCPNVSGEMGMTADHHVGLIFVREIIIVQATIYLREAIGLAPQPIPNADGLFHWAYHAIFHRAVLVQHRAAVFVLGQAREDRRDAAEARSLIAAIRVRFMPVNEFEIPPGDSSKATGTQMLKERMRQPLLRIEDEISQVDIVIAENVNRFHAGQSIEKVHPSREHLADIALPKLEQVAANYQLPLVIFHMIEEGIQFRFPAIDGEIISRPAVTHVKIANLKDRP